MFSRLTPHEVRSRPDLDPVRLRYPKPHGTGAPVVDARATVIPLPGPSPEDIIATREGDLITGLGDGRIIRIDPLSGAVRTMGETAGRPLGLELVEDESTLLICDSVRGLLRMDLASGAIGTLVSNVGGVPLRFCSNAVQAPDGSIWFTESTSRFDFDTYLGAFLERRPSGRLFRLDTSGEVDVVADDLYFANGLTLAPDGSNLLLAETSMARLSRVELHGAAAGRPAPVVENLPAYPDNLSRFIDGLTWCGMVSPRNPLLESLGRAPAGLSKVAWRLPEPALRPRPRDAMVAAFDSWGNHVVSLRVPRAAVRGITGAVRVGGFVYGVSTTHAHILSLEIGDARGISSW